MDTQSKDEQLTQLIHLKRLETPEPEFWSTFEQELKQKHLVALTPIKPSLRSRAGRTAKILVPFILVGATAAIALITISSKKEDTPKFAVQQGDQKLINTDLLPQLQTAPKQGIPVNQKTPQ